MIATEDIARARSFNRLVTRHVGALTDRHLGRRPLAELRVLFEIGAEGATPRDIRVRLGLDSGYVSRMIGALKRDRLVTAEPDPADRRGVLVRLTAEGRTAVDGAFTALLEAERALLADLGDADLDDLTAMLRRLLAPFDA